jgi:hypothetical protein
MPAFARKSPERPIKKETPSKHNPRKLEEQTLPKSINRSAAKYPSLPGVEGAPASTRAFNRARNPPEASYEKERKRHPSLSP